MEDTDATATRRSHGVGCAVAVAALNVLLMGLLAASFASGPYSSTEQEIWYRYGSLGFLLFGAILPAAVLVSSARRHPAVPLATMSWMLLALFACFAYAIYSGGGV